LKVEDSFHNFETFPMDFAMDSMPASFEGNDYKLTSIMTRPAKNIY
jgi:hypothetical protein